MEGSIAQQTITDSFQLLIIQTVMGSSVLAIFICGMHKYWEKLGLNNE